MHSRIALFLILLCTAGAVPAQLSIGIGLPGVSIGINLPLAPQLILVPGYPVYYAPRVDSNYFFYDGMYWVYQDDDWYASSWYNGPWDRVAPRAVPLFILRVPVSYYRRPPSYFGGWQTNTAPRWGEHWGREWEQSHSGWNNWDRRAAPRPAPLPVYQRNYSRDAYPSSEQQRDLHERNYRYQPRDAAVREQVARPQARDTRDTRDTRVSPQVRDTPAPPQARDTREPPQVRDAPAPPPARDTRVPPQVRDAPAPAQERDARGQGSNESRDANRQQEPARERERARDEDNRPDRGRSEDRRQDRGR